MSIKVSVSLEVGNDDQKSRILKAFRRALMEEKVAPKWAVKVTREDKNEGIGDDMPLDLRVFGVTDEADAAPEPTPIEAYAQELKRHGLVDAARERIDKIRSINSLEQREEA